MIKELDILEMLMKIYRALPADDRFMADYIKENAINWYSSDPTKATEPKFQYLGASEGSAPLLIGEAIRAVKCDISAGENKTRTKSNKRSVITKMLKDNVTRPREFAYSTYVRDGRQYATDGVMIYDFAKVDDLLPVCPERYNADWEKLLSNKLFENAENCTIELELPTEKMLAAYIKLHKPIKVWYCFGIDLPTVDPRRLLDMMKALPGMKLYWDGNIKSLPDKEGRNIKLALSPLLAKDGNDNRVILLPIQNGTEEHAGSERTVL